jgi:arabinofuranosyltransferase
MPEQSTRRDWIEDGYGVPVVIGALTLLAITNAFVVDDAFISFRYAENLVRSGEFTWNIGSGERVEGYTNFLWTLILVLPIAAGLDPVLPAQGIGLLAFAGTLTAMFEISRLLFGTRSRALVPVVLFGTHYSASAYATGGLETSLQTFLLTTAALLAARTVEAARWTARSLVSLSALAGAALLNRLDAAIPLCVLAAYVALAWRSAAPAPLPIGTFAAASVIPALALVAPWLAWKSSYYGVWLPNTFFAKAGSSPQSWAHGLAYLGQFLSSYQLLPVLLVLASLGSTPQPRRAITALAVGVAIWALYLITVGGGFMEFRLLVPILPWFFVVLSSLLLTVEDARARATLGLLIVLGSLLHATTFSGANGIASITQLRSNIESTGRNWDGIGQQLAALFAGPGEDVRIAVTAAGAIPYYSKLTTIDMHGLSDPWIARNGVPVSSRPGHQRQPPLSYLLEQEVHLVIGHPRLDPADENVRLRVADLGRFRIADLDPEDLPPNARLIEIPIGEQHRLTALALTPNERVDAQVRALQLNDYAPWSDRSVKARR